MNTAKRLYLDGPFGQIHVHIWGQLDQANHVFICLPPSPYSGRAYDSLAPQLIDDGGVIAVDYPKFSDGNKPSIHDYALVVEAVINQLCGNKSVSLVGFHTGCLVAVETSLLPAAKPDRIILIDVPYFTDEKRKELKSMNLGVFPISDELSDLQSAWDMSVTRQKGRVSPQRSLQMFVDHISAGATAGDPFSAAFSYDCKVQFEKVLVPTCVIATKAGLYDESVRAGGAIKGAILIEEPGIEASVLDKRAATTAKLIRNCLAD